MIRRLLLAFAEAIARRYNVVIVGPREPDLERMVGDTYRQWVRDTEVLIRWQGRYVRVVRSCV